MFCILLSCVLFYRGIALRGELALLHTMGITESERILSSAPGRTAGNVVFNAVTARMFPMLFPTRRFTLMTDLQNASPPAGGQVPPRSLIHPPDTGHRGFPASVVGFSCRQSVYRYQRGGTRLISWLIAWRRHKHIV